ncbi:FeoB-associated Cys-rich membrane protein [Dysgonomonas reticulitermitis]
MVQEIIVGIIGVFIALVIAYKIYGFFFSKNEQKDSCGCSNCGCSTKPKQENIENLFGF